MPKKKEEPPPALVPVEPDAVLAPKSPELPEKVEKRLERLVDQVFEENLDIVRGMAVAAEYDDDIDPAQISEEEAKRWGGAQKARRAKRIARDSRMSTKDAPVYLKNAAAVVGAIYRAKAGEKGGPGVAIQVNVSLGGPAPAATYTVQDVESE